MNSSKKSADREFERRLRREFQRPVRARILMPFDLFVDSKHQRISGAVLLLNKRGQPKGRARFDFDKADAGRFLAAFRDALNAIGPSEEAARAYG